MKGVYYRHHLTSRLRRPGTQRATIKILTPDVQLDEQTNKNFVRRAAARNPS